MQKKKIICIMVVNKLKVKSNKFDFGTLDITGSSESNDKISMPV